MAERREIVDDEKAAKYLNLPVELLRQYRIDARGPRYYHLGDDLVRYSLEDLNRWLNVNAVETVWVMSEDTD